MEKTKVKLPFKTYFTLWVIALGFTATAGVAYFINSYYSLFQNATGYTDIEIGTLISIVGICATCCNVVGGPFCDIVKPKTILVSAYFASAALSFYMLTFPEYKIMKLVFVGIGLTCLLPSTPRNKYVLLFGPPETHGTLTGWYWGFIGANALLVGVIGSAVVANSGTRSGVYTMILIYAVLMLVSAVGLLLLDRGGKGSEATAVKEEKDKSAGFKLGDVADLIKNPAYILFLISALGCYVTGIATTYINPLLSNYCLIAPAALTLISNLRANGTRMVVSPIMGMLGDKNPVKTYIMAAMLAVVGLGMIMLTPWNQASSVICVIALFLIAIEIQAVNTLRQNLLTSMGIPMRVRGTAIGMSLVVLFLPDTFAYTLGGRVITDYGDMGYKIIFGVILACVVVGIVATVILGKIIDKNKTRLN